MPTTDLPFQKKELNVIVLNPTNLPCVDYHKLSILQGDLKTLSKTNMAKLCKSILKHGYFIPAFIWRSGEDMYILDATQRYHALQELEKQGYTIPEIPYIEIEAKDKKDAAQKLLQITSRYGEINSESSFFEDFDIDIEYLKDIAIPELDLAFEELDSKEITEDEIPEVPEEPITQVGDLWTCGSHRVLCGDATKSEDVERLMDGKKADMVFTDPPYGVNYDGGTTKREELQGDKNANIYSFFLPIIQEHSQDAAPFYICYADGDIGILSAILSAKLEIRNNLIWNKSQAQFGALSAQYKQKHEPILYCFKKGKTPCWYGAKNEVTVWDIDRARINDMHPTQKPLGLLARAIKNSSREKDMIVDFFLGSGTTLIAAHQLNRICYGMEIEPKYVDVICQRFFNLTGIDPIRESDGKKWSELKFI